MPPPLLLALAFAIAPALAAAAGDAKRGAQVFRQCMACHSTTPGEHLTGPSLAHAYGRKSASADGFLRYSEALKKSGLVWNEATLDKWLADPQALVRGTSMTFPGLKAGKDRLDVAQFLRAVAEGKAPAAKAQDGMMGMQSRKPDLRKAPPTAQVTALRYCGDTYTVETADGQSEKIWEFNLRLKTDSSKLGPERGKPVAIGAGMQGDRASIVFASPAEISAFIKPSCP